MAFLKGAFWGVVIGGAGAAVVSIVGPQPAGLTPPLPPVTVLQDAPRSPEPSTGAPDLSQVASVDAPGAAPPSGPLTTPDAAPDVPQTDPDSAQPGTVDLAPSEPEAPVTPAAPLDDVPASDAPVLPNPQSIAPQVPEAEADIVVDPTPDAPVEVVTPVEVTPAGPAAEEAEVAGAEGDVAEEVAAATQTPVTVVDPDDPSADLVDPLPPTDATDPTPPDADGVIPDATSDPVAAEVSAAAPTVTVTTPAPDVTVTVTTPTAEPTPDVAAATPAPDTAPTMTLTAPTPDAEPNVATAVGDSVAEAEETADKAPEARATEDLPAVVAIIDAPPRGLPGGASGVTVRRPSLETPAPAEEAPAAEPAVDEDSPALVRYGAFFDNPGAQPLMSIVLRDDGTMPNGARALGEVPFPVTVLLNPAQAGASERMDAYAAAGIEVAALAALPAGAKASDAAVALEGTFDALPRAVALVATDTNGLPTGTEVLEQVVSMLAADGRGLLVPDTGLNSSLRAAEAAEVHAATIYRDLDDNDQDARVIRRFVDQAAFRARQQPGVVLLGRVRPETISALILWGQANRAGQVALAPLSATLLAR